MKDPVMMFPSRISTVLHCEFVTKEDVVHESGAVVRLGEGLQAEVRITFVENALHCDGHWSRHQRFDAPHLHPRLGAGPSKGRHVCRCFDGACWAAAAAKHRLYYLLTVLVDSIRLQRPEHA